MKSKSYVVVYKLNQDFYNCLRKMTFYCEAGKGEYDVLVALYICDQLGLDFLQWGNTWDYECDLNTGVAVIRGK